jgi:hypothetical protein
MSALRYRCPGCGFRLMTRRLCGSCAERTDPAGLWARAQIEHPHDGEARRSRYLELMREHCHLVERQPGDDGNLPCGWPGQPR